MLGVLDPAAFEVVSDRVQLEVIARRGPQRGPAIRLAGALADHPKRQALESRLDQAARACGCQAGDIGLISGLAAGIALLLISPAPSFALGTAVVIGCAILGGAGGVVLGLYAARRRFARAIGEIREAWDVASAVPPPR